MDQLLAQGYGDDVDIPLNQVLERTQGGEVIVLPRALQKLGLFQPLYDLTIDAIRAVSSDRHAKEVQDQGIEHIHHLLSPQQIVDVNVRLSQLPSLVYFKLVRRLVEDGLGYRSGYYVCSTPILRTMVPFDLSNTEKILSSLHPGRTRPLSPHRDSWYPHPHQGLNIWSAMGRVSHGNGMILYPRMWRQSVPHHGIDMAKDQWVGRPITFELEPGDILLFNGEHLHSSEVNVTDETRYVIGTRIVLDQPEYSAGPPWVSYYWAAALGGPLSPFHRLEPYFRKPLFSIRNLRFLVGRTLRKLGLMQYKTGEPKPTKTSSATGSTREQPADLEDGEIRAIDHARIAVRVGDEVSVLSRYCVHQGADLAQGYVKDGRLHCPWHNLCFDPKTGKQPCASLKNLRRFDA